MVLFKKNNKTTKTKTHTPPLASPWKPTKANNYQKIIFAFFL